MIGLTLLFIFIWLTVIAKWPCRFGLHKWDYPGGHCEDCRRCDDFFGEHEDCGKE